MRKYQNILNRLTLIDRLSTIFCDLIAFLIIDYAVSQTIAKSLTADKSLMLNLFLLLTINIVPMLIKQAVNSWNKYRHIHIQMTDDISKAQIRIYKCFTQNVNWTANTVNDNYKLSLPITLNYYYVNYPRLKSRACSSR